MQPVWKKGSTLAQCQPVALLTDHSAYRDADARALGRATGQYRSGGASAKDSITKSCIGLGLTPVAPKPLGHKERIALATCLAETTGIQRHFAIVHMLLSRQA